MTILASLAITTAQAAQVTPAIQFRDGDPLNAILQANFVYGSGGSTVDAWVQTSVDGGATFIDVANFHFTTSSLRAIFTLSLSVNLSAPYMATDGTLAANTSPAGILGTIWRVKYTTVGTYAGGTSLRLDIQASGRSGLLVGE